MDSEKVLDVREQRIDIFVGVANWQESDKNLHELGTQKKHPQKKKNIL